LICRENYSDHGSLPHDVVTPGRGLIPEVEETNTRELWERKQGCDRNQAEETRNPEAQTEKKKKRVK
jgi:hypothetical protein